MARRAKLKKNSTIGLEKWLDEGQKGFRMWMKEGKNKNKIGSRENGKRNRKEFWVTVILWKLLEKRVTSSMICSVGSNECSSTHFQRIQYRLKFFFRAYLKIILVTPLNETMAACWYTIALIRSWKYSSLDYLCDGSKQCIDYLCDGSKQSPLNGDRKYYELYSNIIHTLNWEDTKLLISLS